MDIKIAIVGIIWGVIGLLITFGGIYLTLKIMGYTIL